MLSGVPGGRTREPQAVESRRKSRAAGKQRVLAGEKVRQKRGSRRRGSGEASNVRPECFRKALGQMS